MLHTATAVDSQHLLRVHLAHSANSNEDTGTEGPTTPGQRSEQLHSQRQTQFSTGLPMLYTSGRCIPFNILSSRKVRQQHYLIHGDEDHLSPDKPTSNLHTQSQTSQARLQQEMHEPRLRRIAHANTCHTAACATGPTPHHTSDTHQLHIRWPHTPSKPPQHVYHT